jgi:threonine dehydratase
VAIACGANMNFDRLRFVAERAEVGEQREAVFAVTIPEERGSFRASAHGRPRNVTEFNYRIADAPGSRTCSSASRSAPRGGAAIAATSRRASRRSTSPTTSSAKLHVRHLVGGHSVLARDELLYRFEFPERPGALMRSSPA